MIVDKIVDQLRKAEKAAQAKLDDLAKQVASSKADLKQIQAALLAFTKKDSAEAKPKKASATKAEVVKAIAAVLSKKEIVPANELKTAVEKRIVASGKSRTGFALRFKEALSDKSFEETKAGYRVTDTVS